jgi:methionyl-tRNA formyltransferase
MMGTGEFAEPTFTALLQTHHQMVALITQPDRQGGARRGSTRLLGGVKERASQLNIPIHQPESINTPEGLALLTQLTPDLLVVAAYGQILSRDVLSVPKLGGINVHASLLPKYRGAAPIAWAIANGETRTGVTIIHMSPALDAGDMLAQEALDILPTETTGDLEARLAPLGAQMTLKVIEELLAGTARGLIQDKSQATKAPKLTKEHGLIDWTQSAKRVCQHIRAMQPWPTAYTFLHREGKPPLRVIISRAAPSDRASTNSLNPGQTISHQQQLLVASGHGELVEIHELQPAGKKRMTASEFLRGHSLDEASYFGS